MVLTRRDVLGSAAAVAVVASSSNRVLAQAPPAWNQPAPGTHVPVPLPYSAEKLPGLSARLITSHHENNYGGAVKNLNKVELELARLPKDAPPFETAGLRQAELQFRNSMVLHELYFANLGGDGKPSGSVAVDLGSAFGGIARFEDAFRQAAAGLYGGSGWVTLGLDLHTRALTVTAARDHTQASAATLPLLVLDMYEHSYQMDFGAAAARYVDAFWQNVAWPEVDRRHARARAVLQAR